jgi:hypothetical protein
MTSKQGATPHQDRAFWVDGESAVLFEISMGRCGILLLCHKLSAAVPESLADCFHTKCPEPFIVAILAREGDHCQSRAHARVVFGADHSALAAVLQQRLAAEIPQVPFAALSHPRDSRQEQDSVQSVPLEGGQLSDNEKNCDCPNDCALLSRNRGRCLCAGRRRGIANQAAAGRVDQGTDE